MKDYKFTSTWFEDVARKYWEDLFKQIPKPNRLLEVGCFEGRATTWLCDNVLTGGEVYDIVDTFKGSVEESGMRSVGDELIHSVSYIENNFRHNISYHPDITFNIHKGYSQTILATFPEEEVYDFIYIDASHRADDTFVDAYYANKLLKPGGFIIFDDFGWKDPKNMHVCNSPEYGVRMFGTMYDQQYTLVYNGYQVGFIKNNRI